MEWSCARLLCPLANFNLLILAKLKYLLDRTSLQNIYFSYIRPIIEYGNVLLSNCSKELNHNLESLQLEAARIITGGVKGTHHNQLYAETGWQTLEKRRENAQVILIN